MENIDHIMPKPVVVPVFWGHDYVANPATVNQLMGLLSDLVTGPFMNGLAQYGVRRGSVNAAIVIDDQSPPATITYTDGTNQLKDEITKRLAKWIREGKVPPPASPSDVNQLYLILPPTQTTPLKFNGDADPLGNGVQGFHNEGRTDPPPPPTLFWAIVKTNDVGAPSTSDFINGVAPKISHELVEQFVDRNGTFEEIGDGCVGSLFEYRGRFVERYTSDLDKSAENPNGCINGDQPVSLKRFLAAINFDLGRNGLRSLGTSTINIDFIAVTMQLR
jgi:hypothetical protein